MEPHRRAAAPTATVAQSPWAAGTSRTRHGLAPPSPSPPNENQPRTVSPKQRSPADAAGRAPLYRVDRSNHMVLKVDLHYANERRPVPPPPVLSPPSAHDRHQQSVGLSPSPVAPHSQHLQADNASSPAVVVSSNRLFAGVSPIHPAGSPAAHQVDASAHTTAMSSSHHPSARRAASSPPMRTRAWTPERTWDNSFSTANAADKSRHGHGAALDKRTRTPPPQTAAAGSVVLAQGSSPSLLPSPAMPEPAAVVAATRRAMAKERGLAMDRLRLEELEELVRDTRVLQIEARYRAALSTRFRLRLARLFARQAKDDRVAVAVSRGRQHRSASSNASDVSHFDASRDAGEGHDWAQARADLSAEERWGRAAIEADFGFDHALWFEPAFSVQLDAIWGAEALWAEQCAAFDRIASRYRAFLMDVVDAAAQRRRLAAARASRFAAEREELVAAEARGRHALSQAERARVLQLLSDESDAVLRLRDNRVQAAEARRDATLRALRDRLAGVAEDESADRDAVASAAARALQALAHWEQDRLALLADRTRHRRWLTLEEERSRQSVEREEDLGWRAVEQALAAALYQEQTAAMLRHTATEPDHVVGPTAIAPRRHPSLPMDFDSPAAIRDPPPGLRHHEASPPGNSTVAAAGELIYSPPFGTDDSVAHQIDPTAAEAHDVAAKRDAEAQVALHAQQHALRAYATGDNSAAAPRHHHRFSPVRARALSSSLEDDGAASPGRDSRHTYPSPPSRKPDVGLSAGRDRSAGRSRSAATGRSPMRGHGVWRPSGRAPDTLLSRSPDVPNPASGVVTPSPERGSSRRASRSPGAAPAQRHHHPHDGRSLLDERLVRTYVRESQLYAESQVRWGQVAGAGQRSPGLQTPSPEHQGGVVGHDVAFTGAAASPAREHHREAAPSTSPASRRLSTTPSSRRHHHHHHLPLEPADYQVLELLHLTPPPVRHHHHDHEHGRRSAGGNNTNSSGGEDLPRSGSEPHEELTPQSFRHGQRPPSPATAARRDAAVGTSPLLPRVVAIKASGGRSPRLLHSRGTASSDSKRHEQVAQRRREVATRAATATRTTTTSHAATSTTPRVERQTTASPAAVARTTARAKTPAADRNRRRAGSSTAAVDPTRMTAAERLAAFREAAVADPAPGPTRSASANGDRGAPATQRPRRHVDATAGEDGARLGRWTPAATAGRDDSFENAVAAVGATGRPHTAGSGSPAAGTTPERTGRGAGARVSTVVERLSRPTAASAVRAAAQPEDDPSYVVDPRAVREYPTTLRRSTADAPPPQHRIRTGRHAATPAAAFVPDTATHAEKTRRLIRGGALTANSAHGNAVRPRRSIGGGGDIDVEFAAATTEYERVATDAGSDRTGTPPPRATMVTVSEPSPEQQPSPRLTDAALSGRRDPAARVEHTASFIAEQRRLARGEESGAGPASSTSPPPPAQTPSKVGTPQTSGLPPMSPAQQGAAPADGSERRKRRAENPADEVSRLLEDPSLIDDDDEVDDAPAPDRGGGAGHRHGHRGAALPRGQWPASPENLRHIATPPTAVRHAAVDALRRERNAGGDDVASTERRPRLASNVQEGGGNEPPRRAPMDIASSPESPVGSPMQSHNQQRIHPPRDVSRAEVLEWRQFRERQRIARFERDARDALERMEAVAQDQLLAAGGDDDGTASAATTDDDVAPPPMQQHHPAVRGSAALFDAGDTIRSSMVPSTATSQAGAGDVGAPDEHRSVSQRHQDAPPKRRSLLRPVGAPRTALRGAGATRSAVPASAVAGAGSAAMSDRWKNNLLAMYQQSTSTVGSASVATTPTRTATTATSATSLDAGSGDRNAQRRTPQSAGRRSLLKGR